ncbi:MAG: EVE domain-containing protein, partial [Proteobacteria bacterium]|nr:EVE domain-containing protein [Pseudomonadota bacterium]
PIRPLLATLAFASVAPNWGARLRFGLFAISDDDLMRIAGAMKARLPG